MILALTIGVLIAGAAYLILDRSYLRVVLGFLMLGHAVNLVLFAAGGTQRRGEPLEGTDPAMAADPLPQAFVLTAIVIAFAITVVMLVLTVTGRAGDDTTDTGDRGDGADGQAPPATNGDRPDARTEAAG